MTDPLLQTGAWVVFALVAGFMLVNAVCMLLVPQSWFSLPRWLRLQGSQSRELYEDRWSGLQLRLLGAVIIAAVGGIAFALIRTAGSK